MTIPAQEVLRSQTFHTAIFFFFNKKDPYSLLFCPHWKWRTTYHITSYFESFNKSHNNKTLNHVNSFFLSRAKWS